MLWTAVRRMGVPLRPATAVVALLSATAPLAVYGSEVYPELPAALAVAVALAALMGPLGRGGLWALGLGVIALPWLSVKYTPVALVLAAIGLWLLWRSGRARTAGVLVGALAAAAIAHVAVHLAIYDGLTPYASGSHFTGGELTVVGDDPHYLGRSRRLVGLMVDRDFGLAAWQPAWLLLVPAVAALAARRPRGAGALGLTLLTGWLIATFVALTMQGWWFPGRQLVVVLPAAVLAIAWWAGGGGRRLAAVLSLGALGLLTYAWLLVEGLSGRVTWAADLQTTANPLYRGMRYALPDYLHVTAGTWLLHWAWLAAGLAVGAVTYARERGRPWRDQSEKTKPAGRPGSAAMTGRAAARARWNTPALSPNSRARVSGGVASGSTPLAWSVTNPTRPKARPASPASTVSGPPVWLTAATPAAASWAISLTLLSRGPSTWP